MDTVSYSTAIVTMDLSCIVNEIKRDIGQDRDFSYLLAFDASVRGSPSECSHTVWCGKTRMAWPPDGGKGMSRPVARDLGSLKTPNSKMSTNFVVPLACLVSCVNGTRPTFMAVLHVHYMHKIDLLEVVDKFSKKHPRRMQLDSVLFN